MLGCYSNIIHMLVVSLQDLALHCAKHIRKTELTKQNKSLYHSLQPLLNLFFKNTICFATHFFKVLTNS